MKRQQALLSALTIVNVAALAVTLSLQTGSAAPDTVANVVRARALEIVDAQGRVRATLSVLPEDPNVKWNGKPYPETVLLRLITADGRPNVKLGASRTGSALLIAGEDDPTYVQVLAQGGDSTVKLVDKNGAERVIKP